MPDLGQELMEMKGRIDNAKTEAAHIQGQIDQLLKQRAEELGCADDAAAEAYIEELETDIAQLGKGIEEGINTIKEELGW